MDRFLCIHCHFYQPPRENPWLEAIELQDSAEPYHDWNERVSAECYAPNSAARILEGDGRIAKIVNNYASISFNFGPTVLSWMQETRPNVYEAVLEADRVSRARFSGHGNAIAQIYNHMILPLANERDRYTQVRWGLRDFEHRFGREPEGMWLAETAVDVLTLEVLADCGIRFTVLAQHQAKQVRKLGVGGRGRNVEGAKIDPTRPYLCRLPSGREITLFFYDGPISRAVAFEGLLSNGEHFASRLLSGFSETRKWPQLMHIATDGETYGHHHAHGDMALAYALEYISSRELARITNYGEFLELHPPTHAVEIIENTSWSCVHGVERWKSDCGCNSGMNAGWNQQWRAPLRDALDMLRDKLAGPFEQQSRDVLRDPWAARDAYINVILDRGPESLDSFFQQHAANPDDREARVRALKWLEMQRHLMLMYTSCGWFFDELSGLETVQVIMYASRALQLAHELLGNEYEHYFLELLAKTPSNVPEVGNGANIYTHWVKPAELDLLKVGAHYAISSLFGNSGTSHSIYCYDIVLKDHQRENSGRAQLAIGHAGVRSRITLEQADVSFGAVHFGDHNVNAGVRPFRGEDEYQQLVLDAKKEFAASDMPATIRVLDRHFEGISYSLKSLFKDEQRRILREILGTTLGETESSYRQIYEHHAPLMAFLTDLGAQMPHVLRVTADFVINAELRHAFERDELSLAVAQSLLETARREHIPLDVAGLTYALKRRIASMANELSIDPQKQNLVRYKEAVALARSLPFEVDLWRMQNIYYQLLQKVYPEMAASSDESARAWAIDFVNLGEVLGVLTPESSPREDKSLSAA